MKKILCLIDSLNQGGAQRQLIGLASFLNRRDEFDVFFLWYHKGGFYEDLLKQSGVHLLNPVANNKVSKFFAVSKAIKTIRPDVVISFLDSPNVIACLLARLGYGFRLIVSERVAIYNLNLKSRVRFYLYKYCDKIVSNSFTQLDFIKSHYPYLQSKCNVITNFTDTNIFRLRPRSIGNLGNRKVIVVGRISPEKNTLALIEVLYILKNKGCLLHVDWYGAVRDNVFFDSCKQKLSEYGLLEFFCFHSPVNHIEDIYPQYDFFCLPSLREGFPNVICEAMSCGLPVVCSSICDNPRIILDGKTGLLFDPLNIDDMVEKIFSMVNMSNEKLIEMGNLGRSRAVKDFSIESFAEKYIKLIKTL